ncbi:hypothetical protein BKA93DRAFT_362011 [Sparassis latifolia]
MCEFEMIGCAPHPMFCTVIDLRIMHRQIVVVSTEGKMLMNTYIHPIIVPNPCQVSETYTHSLEQLNGGMTLAEARHELGSILRDKLVVGFAVHRLFLLIGLQRPLDLRHIRYLSLYIPLRRILRCKDADEVPLSVLVYAVLRLDISYGPYDCVENVHACHQLYLHYQRHWEYSESVGDYQSLPPPTTLCFT